MRVVELFAGVGGFRLGLERAGHSVVWANEWDRYAADIYDKNFGGKIDRRSITEVPAEDIPAHDLICGGFPCQAFSVAGKRQGFAETRGTLFFDIMRIAKYHRTPYLLLENVKGLLNHDEGRTFEVILKTLDELGYDAEWQVCNSKDFGVPQNRERIIIIANLRTAPRPEVFPISGAEREVPQAGGDAGGRAQAFIKTRHLSQNGSLISDSITLQASETPHIIDGKPSSTRRGFVKNGYTGALDTDAGKQLVANTLRSSDGGASERDNFVVHRNHGVIEQTADQAHTIDSNYHKGLDNHGQRTGVSDGDRIRKLTPVECERLQGFPDNWTAGVSDNQRYKQMGNAVTTNVIEAVAQRLPVGVAA